VAPRDRGPGILIDDLLLELRDGLGHDDDDPAHRLLGGRRRPRPEKRAERPPAGEELEALRTQLRDRESAIQRMRSERDRLAGELQKRALVGAEATVAEGTVAEEDARRLRRKIEELQAELRRSQQERLELRRELPTSPAARAEERRAPPMSTAAAADEESGDGLEPDEEATVYPVEFTDAFDETAADLEGRLVLRAQEVAVRFATLDPATWKQAKKMADLRDVFTLRVGIHHRLFVTRRDGRVAARELVPREAFERTLKRYRR
jgi:hypothetical protein